MNFKDVFASAARPDMYRTYKVVRIKFQLGHKTVGQKAITKGYVDEAGEVMED